MRLASDFLDYYDHHFDSSGPLFLRKTQMGLSRPEMFMTLQKRGLLTPVFGRVRDIAPFNQEDIIVYTDIHAHQGIGKARMASKEALKHHPDQYGSLYVESLTQRATHLRLVLAGNLCDWLLYENTDEEEWRSNVGDVNVSILDADHPLYHEFWQDLRKCEDILKRQSPPLLAVDFLPTEMGLVALDWNVSPRLKGTGLENKWEPAIIAQQLKAASSQEMTVEPTWSILHK